MAAEWWLPGFTEKVYLISYWIITRHRAFPNFIRAIEADVEHISFDYTAWSYVIAEIEI